MLRYLGGGFLRGVPARDLTDAEAAHYGIGRLIASGLYSSSYPDMHVLDQIEEANNPETGMPEPGSSEPRKRRGKTKKN